MAYNNNKKTRNNNTLAAALVLPTDITQELADEIVEVLKGTAFNKISFPLYCYRADVDSKVAQDDNRMTSAGYVKKFDHEKNQFIVGLYNNNAETIKGFNKPVIEVIFNTYNGKLGVITKLVITPTFEEPQAVNAEGATDNTPIVEESVVESPAE